MCQISVLQMHMQNQYVLKLTILPIMTHGAFWRYNALFGVKP